MERGDNRGQRGAKKNGAVSSEGDDDAEPAGIERLLGIAMGCMGMSMDDFCRCVPSSFYAAYEAWGEMREQQERAEWERMRMQCLCSLQPYSKDRLRPRDVMQFPWEVPGSEEKKVKSEETSCPATEHEELSHEELMARYREAKERFGLS